MSLPVILGRRAQVEAANASFAAFYSSAASTANKQTRSRKRARLDAESSSVLLPALLIGPPDPISNLRPIRYLNNSNSSSNAALESKALSANDHPYSTSEFTSSSVLLTISEQTRRKGRPPPIAQVSSSSSTTTTTASGAAAVAAQIPPSEYYSALLAQLESASLAHRLRNTRAWSYDHRFWADNNARFTRDLEDSSSVNAPREAARAEEGGGGGGGGNEHAAEFYQSWLSANADRHRAYNRALVSRIFGDMAPEARFRLLLGWVRVVGWWEREVRTRVLRLLGMGFRSK